MRKYYWIGALTLIAAASYFAGHFAFHVKAYAQVRAVPFVLETASYNFENNPRGDFFLGKTVARRSDGATAEIESSTNFAAPSRTVTFLNGAAFRAFDLIRSKTSVTLNQKEIAALNQRLTNPPSDCVMWRNATVIDRPILFGEQLVVVQHVTTSGHRLTYTFAPRLGCEEVGWRHETIQPDGSFRVKTELRLVSLTFKEPEAALFDPAANYEEVLPSEILRRELQKVGKTPTQKDLEQAARTDAKVKAHQK